MKSLFLDALHGRNHSGKLPVWLMRQAGRYLHEYRALRERHDFMELIQNKDLIVEITSMPITIFGFDAAIIFSDILLICQYLGFDLQFHEGSGPHLTPALSHPKDIERMRGYVISEVPYLTEAIKELKKSLQVPLLGFAGAPFTVASYLIEGKSSQSMRKTKKWLLDDPKSFHMLLEILTTRTIEYLNLQIDAGVDAIQLFDTWAEKLAFPQFQEFSVAYMQKVLKGLKKAPVIVFCKGSGSFVHELSTLAPQALSIDWQCDIARIRQELGPQMTLQGNLDPDVLLSTPLTLKREVQRLLKAMKGDPAFIFNLGHGILPETPRENVEVLLECLRS